MRTSTVLWRSRLAFSVFLYAPLALAQIDHPIVFEIDSTDRAGFRWVGSNDVSGWFSFNHDLDRGSLLSSHNSTGEIEWTSEVYVQLPPGPSNEHVVLASNGGVMYIRCSIASIGIDSGQAVVHLTRLTSAGDLLWTEKIVSDYSGTTAQSLHSSVALGDENDLFVLVSGSAQRNFLFHFGPDGEVLRVDQIDLPAFMYGSHLLGDGAGGYFIGISSQLFNGTVGLVHIDENGDLDWSRSFRHSGSAYQPRIFDMIAAENGDILLYGAHPDAWFSIRFTQMGAVNSYRRHVVDQIVPTSWLSGGLALAANGDVWATDQSALLRILPDGTCGAAFIPVQDVQDSARVWWTIDAPRCLLYHDELHYAGARRRKQAIGIFHASKPFISRVPSDNGDCIVQPVEVQTTVLDDELDAEEMPTELTMVGGVVTTFEIQMGPAPSGVSTNICLTDGVGELEASSLSFHSTTIIRGGYIEISLEEPVLIEMFDANGRLIFASQVRTPQARISTEACVPGLYLIRCVSNDGAVRTGRCVVQ